MGTLQPTRLSAVDKGLLRKELLARRRALSPATVATASAAIRRRVMALPRWRTAREVLLYLPVRGEVDTRPLAEDLLATGRRLLVPRCRDKAPGQLDLGCLQQLDDARPGHFGIPEPPEEHCLAPEAFAPDLIVVPGVAFDRSGARLGFGGGYYDRLLASPMAAKAFVVGLCYDFQLLKQIPAEAWDQPMHAVITELATHWCTA